MLLECAGCGCQTSVTAGTIFQDTRTQWRVDNHAGYVQDNWRALPRLTLNLGVRYEYYTPVKELNGLALLPRLVDNDPISTLRSNATLDFASGSSRPLYNPDRNNFAPNAGLAWDMFGDGKTALRAAYSLNFVNDEFLVALTGNANTNAGLSQVVSNPTALTNLIRDGLPAIAVPAFKVPRTFQDNYNLKPATNFGIADSNLRTPYVQQWNISIERELKGFSFNVRYVGNQATKLNCSARWTTTRSTSMRAASWRTSSARSRTVSWRWPAPVSSTPPTMQTSLEARC